jgi:hypothetical protein
VLATAILRGNVTLETDSTARVYDNFFTKKARSFLIGEKRTAINYRQVKGDAYGNYS